MSGLTESGSDQRVATVVAVKMLYVQDVLSDDIEVKGDRQSAEA
ncbi:MAG: hypothetical protein WD768_02085 [Phycisphaeraceae bacterium]